MDESEEVKEIPQTWNKFSTSAKKAGYREGAAHGRDQSFQKSFDCGFEEGIKNGFALGRYKGALRAQSLQTTQVDEDDSRLKYSRRALCQICSDSTLLEKPIDVITEMQTKVCNNLLKDLHCKHSSNINIQLPH